MAWGAWTQPRGSQNTSPGRRTYSRGGVFARYVNCPSVKPVSVKLRYSRVVFGTIGGWTGHAFVPESWTTRVTYESQW